MAKKKAPRSRAVLIVGLGRFGAGIAATLEEMGREVLAVEQDERLVALWSRRVPVVEADATDPDALEQLGARDFPVAVVGVGTTLEASVLATANLVDLQVPQIWAKATSAEHGRILRRIGADHVVYPEHDAGQRVAHLVSGRMLDYIAMEDGFTIVKMHPPRETHGKTIGELRIRSQYGINVLGVQSPGRGFEYAEEQTRLNAEDVIIVSGDSDLLEAFAARR